MKKNREEIPCNALEGRRLIELRAEVKGFDLEAGGGEVLPSRRVFNSKVPEYTHVEL